MKLKFFFATLFFIILQVSADPLLVAVLMVKNEASVMEMTLQPLVDAGIKDFLIYDTGSTDDTIQVTKEFFIKNNISNFVIEQGNWFDFSTSRNRALALTEEHFPDATFMLMLDAEWILHNGTELIDYCEQHKNSSVTLFYITIKDIDVHFLHPKLIRTHSNIEFVGKVHEAPNIVPQETVPSHIYFELHTTFYGHKKSQDRWKHDIDILLQEFQDNPDNPRTVNYLAQTYFALGDLQNAITWYEHRATMSGWEEEDFMALFLLAQVYEAAGDAEKMIYTYLRAFAKRSNRAEPLIKLSEYFYNNKSYYLSYLFARHAVTIPYPHQDFSLVEQWLYEFARYDLLSGTAYIVGDYKLGKQATLKALEACPDLEYLQKNLKFYEKMLS